MKRSRVGPEAVGQLRRYVDALGRELEEDAEDDGGDVDGAGRTVRGFLIAPSVTEPALRLLESDGYEFVSLAPEPGSAGV